jgi:hypothetical protein
MFFPSKAALAISAASVGCACFALGQVPGPAPTPFPVSTAESPTIAAPITATPAAASVAGSLRPSIARVTIGNGILPNDHGQIWREYDIRPYTLRATADARPEQAIVDWVLRETGYEVWHSEPLGILSANRTTLRAYHTPEMQAVVSQMVDRFVNPQAQSQTFNMRVVSMGSQSWRTKALKIMHAVPVQSQGIQAWLLAKEDASLLIAEIRKRSDFREYSSPSVLCANGQSTVVSTMHPRGYTGAVVLHPEQLHPGFEPQVLQFNEGFSIDFNPLLSLDGQSVDAMIKCDVDQLERLVAVTVNVPTPIAPRQHTEIEVPQSCSYRLRERFHWPADQVLLISFGVIAAPIASESPIRLSLNPGPARAELLVFVENRGRGANPVAATLPTTALPAAAMPTVPLPAQPLTDRRGMSPIYRSPY